MEEKIVWLTDYNAEQDYPFIFKVGERVRSKTDRRRGVVKNAKFEGQAGGGAFDITYHIETDDGEVTELPILDLEKA